MRTIFLDDNQNFYNNLKAEITLYFDSFRSYLWKKDIFTDGVMILGLRKDHIFWNSTFKIPKKLVLLLGQMQLKNLSGLTSIYYALWISCQTNALIIPVPNDMGVNVTRASSQVSNSRSDSWSFLVNKEERYHEHK